MAAESPSGQEANRQQPNQAVIAAGLQKQKYKMFVQVAACFAAGGVVLTAFAFGSFQGWALLAAFGIVAVAFGALTGL